MAFNLKKLVPHLLVILGFIIASVAYFSPVISGKVLFQSDIQQAQGMSHERNEYVKKHHKEAYWIDNAFGGTPRYLPSSSYPNEYVRSIDNFLRFLPHPAGYLFLYFLGIYLLFLVFKVDYKLAAIGALAFGFSTYLMIIIGVGHNSKVHAIAYMPLVLAGVFSVFKKKYLWGGILLAISLALEIYAGHYQITYYLMYIIIIIGLVHLYKAFKDKELPRFFKSVGIMFIALILALAANSTRLMTIQQLAKFSTRGDTGVTVTKNGHPKNDAGLSYDYITQYSYGIAETMDLFIPRFMGGATTEPLGVDSHTYDALIKLGVPAYQAKQFLQHAPTYWGKQPIVAAPAYIGATVIFFFVLALFLVKGRLKWWVVGACALSLLLSWGHNFNALTRFFVDYVPFYNKFRTVSMIQVILELLIPFFGIYGLSKLFSSEKSKDEKMHALKWTTIITAGVCVFFLLFKNWIFDFAGLYDTRYLKNLGPTFVEALRKDRAAMMSSDTLRSLIFVLLIAACLYAYLKQKLNKNVCIGIFAVLILVDLVSVDRDYVNDSNFITRQQKATPFVPNAADLAIMKDKGHYRVMDLSVNPMNSGRASYFHKSIGGYSGTKPGRIEELYSFYLADLKPQVVNMMNIKYFIVKQKDKYVAQLNPDANGSVWFVNKIDFVNSPNGEILALDSINTKTTAVVNTKFNTAVTQNSFVNQPGDTIYLKDYNLNKIVYQYTAHNNRFAVFSENYYPYGWEATVDGKPIEIIQTDFVLRGLMLPKGTHTVVFTFNPKVIQTGGAITLASGIILALLVIGGLFFTFKQRKNLTSKKE